MIDIGLLMFRLVSGLAAGIIVTVVFLHRRIDLWIPLVLASFVVSTTIACVNAIARTEHADRWLAVHAQASRRGYVFIQALLGVAVVCPAAFAGFALTFAMLVVG